VYKLQVRRRAEKALDKLPDRDYERVVEAILRLKENPRPVGCAKLVGGIYRVRVGAYRVVYLIDDAARLVDIGKVDRRRERTYKDLEDLFT
jgi:mRNA interferase RelE/StbE